MRGLALHEDALFTGDVCWIWVTITVITQPEAVWKGFYFSLQLHITVLHGGRLGQELEAGDAEAIRECCLLP